MQNTLLETETGLLLVSLTVDRRDSDNLPVYFRLALNFLIQTSCTPPLALSPSFNCLGLFPLHM